MKLKKIAAVLLSGVFVLSAIGVSAIDATDKKFISGYGVAKDDLEQTGITARTQIMCYPYWRERPDGESSFISEVVAEETAGNNDLMWITPNAGADGSTVLEIKSSKGNHPQIVTKYISDFYTDGELDTNKVAVFTYDLNIQTNPVDTYVDRSFRISVGAFDDPQYEMFAINKDAKGFYFTNYNDSASFYYELNHWYKVQLVQTATERLAYLLDGETGEVLLSAEKTAAPLTNAKKQYFTIFYLNPSGGKNTEFIAYLDNLTMNILDMQNAPQLLEQSIEDNAEDIARNQSILLSFDKPLATDLVTVENVTNPENLPEYEVKRLDAFRQKIEFLKPLERNTAYKVNLSQVDNSTGFGFTTKTAYQVGFAVKDKQILSDNKSMNVTYSLKDAGITKLSCRVLGVLYENNQMADLDIILLNNVAANGDNSLTLNFTKEIKAGSEVRLIPLEQSVLIPLAIQE